MSPISPGVSGRQIVAIATILDSLHSFSSDTCANDSKVVPNESSSLDSRKYGNDTIHANHMNMCRFSTKDDDGYEKFSAVLAKYISEIKTKQSEAKNARNNGQSSPDLWFESPSIDGSHKTNALLFQIF